MSDGRFVVNASPLILLSKVGQLDCLKGLASTVVESTLAEVGE